MTSVKIPLEVYNVYLDHSTNHSIEKSMLYWLYECGAVTAELQAAKYRKGSRVACHGGLLLRFTRPQHKKGDFL